MKATKCRHARYILNFIVDEVYLNVGDRELNSRLLQITFGI